jgi:enterochelin esterase-like enzyme
MLILIVAWVMAMLTGSAAAVDDRLRDRCPGTPSRFEAFSLFAPALDRTKRLLVYLPPGYDCEQARNYPVFYFNDGHDLFDWNPYAAELDPALAAEITAREGWYGSWQLEIQLDHAVTKRDLSPLIVVGVASDDGQRSRDLAPAPWDGSEEARGSEYAAFVARTVVAAVESRYRTIEERRCRAIGGASLGGVSALDIGIGYSDTFGQVLAFSPLLAEPAFANHLAATFLSARVRPALLVDFDDDERAAADRTWFTALVAASAYPAAAPILRQTRGGRHAIGSWAARVIPAMRQLLASCDSP